MAQPAQVTLAGPAHARGASVGVVMAAAAVTTGAVLGGLPGAGLGLTLLGGMRNAAHAATTWNDPDAAVRRDAGKSGMMALIEFGVAGWLTWYLATQRKNS